MKHFFIFYTTVFLCLNTYGQNIYDGKIIYTSNPCQTEPCLPGVVFGLETISNIYVLTINSNWIWSENNLIIEDIEYFNDDRVEITGVTTTKQDINSNEYTELEIKTIKKMYSSIGSVSFSNDKVYYDEIKQIIVMDATLQNQSLTFELMDMQGKVVLKETSMANNSLISIDYFLRGVYLYRITRDGLIVCTGKIVKSN